MLHRAVLQRRLFSGIFSARRSLLAVQLPWRGETVPRHAGLTTSTAARTAALDAPVTGQATPVSNDAIAAAPNAPTFQEAIARLQEYWASVGCAVWLPHNTEVSHVAESQLFRTAGVASQPASQPAGKGHSGESHSAGKPALPIPKPPSVLTSGPPRRWNIRGLPSPGTSVAPGTSMASPHMHGPPIHGRSARGP